MALRGKMKVSRSRWRRAPVEPERCVRRAAAFPGAEVAFRDSKDPAGPSWCSPDRTSGVDRPGQRRGSTADGGRARKLGPLWEGSQARCSRWAVRRDHAAVRQQLAGVLKDHDPVAQEAPACSGGTPPCGGLAVEQSRWQAGSCRHCATPVPVKLSMASMVPPWALRCGLNHSCQLGPIQLCIASASTFFTFPSYTSPQVKR